MIEANELRIGNIVEFKDPLTNEVERIEIDSDDFDLIYKKNNGHRYFPIPLLPEILEKAGFKKESIFGYYMYGGGLYRWKDGELKINTFQSDDFGDFVYLALPYKYKYVHQLQNLIFALTGTDLSLQL